jgi:hypothetical protein
MRSILPRRLYGSLREGCCRGRLAGTPLQSLLGALDRVEGAKTPNDHLVGAFIERSAAGLTLRH